MCLGPIIDPDTADAVRHRSREKLHASVAEKSCTPPQQRKVARLRARPAAINRYLMIAVPFIFVQPSVLIETLGSWFPDASPDMLILVLLKEAAVLICEHVFDLSPAKVSRRRWLRCWTRLVEEPQNVTLFLRLAAGKRDD